MICLRATTTADLAEVVAWEADVETVSWLGVTGLAWHERALADSDQEHLVAVRARTLVGFVVLAGLSDGDGAVELRRMVVGPNLRGAGYGRALLTAALTRAYRDHRAHGIWLDVRVHNQRARNLYESEGFVPAQTLASAAAESDRMASDLLIMVHRRQ